MNTPYNGVSGDSNDVALPNTKVILYNKLGKKLEKQQLIMMDAIYLQ